MRLTAILALSVLSAPAAAQGGGAWRFEAQAGAVGLPACAMEIRAPDRLVRIERQAAGGPAVFRIARAGWRIPPGESVSVLMQIDREEPLLVRNARGSATPSPSRRAAAATPPSSRASPAAPA